MCQSPVKHDIVHDADCWCGDAALYEIAYVPLGSSCGACNVTVMCVYVCVCVCVCVCVRERDRDSMLVCACLMYV